MSFPAKKIRDDEYNLSAFEESTPASQAELRLIKREKIEKRDVTIKMVLCFAAALTISAMIIYNNMMLNELTDDINQAQATYDALRSEYQRLTVLSESQLSLRNIEERAKEQGMAPIASYQIEYVKIEGDEHVEIYEAPPSIFDKLADSFRAFVEYLNT